MSLNFCDLLVLGSDLSGVIAATLLAKRGMNVLLLDDDEESDHFPNLMTGLESRAFKSLLGKLMIPEAKAQIVQENQVTCQVLFPKNRIDLSSSRDNLMKEIGREFPQEKGIFEGFLSEIDTVRDQVSTQFLSFFPICSGKEKRQFLDWLRKLPDQKIVSCWNQFSPPLQTMVRLLIRFLSRGPLLEPLTLQLLLYLSPENCATFSIRGGVRELKKIFYEKLDYFGGLVHPLGEEFTIEVKGREVRAVRLNRYNFPTRCRFLMGNMNLQTFYQKLPRNLWSFWAKRKMEGISPVESHFSTQFEVSRNFLPGPMRENLVVIGDPTAPLEGLNCLEINIASPPRQASSREPQDTALLSVLYRMPPGVQREERVFESIHAEIEKVLRRLIPFAGDSLRRIFPRPEEPGALFPTSADYPLFLHSARKRNAYFPSFTSPGLSTPFRNAFSLGPGLLEWLGFEGKLLGAMKGVEMIWEKDSKIKK